MHLKVGGNIDLTIMKGAQGKAEIGGRNNLAERLTLQNDFESRLISKYIWGRNLILICPSPRKYFTGFEFSTQKQYTKALINF